MKTDNTTITMPIEQYGALVSGNQLANKIANEKFIRLDSYWGVYYNVSDIEQQDILKYMDSRIIKLEKENYDLKKCLDVYEEMSIWGFIKKKFL